MDGLVDFFAFLVYGRSMMHFQSAGPFTQNAYISSSSISKGFFGRGQKLGSNAYFFVKFDFRANTGQDQATGLNQTLELNKYCTPL
jgi:hypothetical protein